MKQPLSLSAILLLASAAAAQHRLAIQGNDRLAILDAGGNCEWEMPWGGIHDIHVLPGGNLMVQRGSDQVVEIDVGKKEVVWTYDSGERNGNAGKLVEVHAFQPLADDRVMIAESGPARILEVNRAGEILHEVALKLDHPAPH